MKRLPAINQEYYDENRNLYDAETTTTEISPKACDHYLKRITYTEVQCEKCLNTWRDMNKWSLKDGKIV